MYFDYSQNWTGESKPSWMKDFVDLEMSSKTLTIGDGKEDKEMVVLKVLRFNMYHHKNNNHLKVSEIQDMGQKIR